MSSVITIGNGVTSRVVLSCGWLL